MPPTDLEKNSAQQKANAQAKAKSKGPSGKGKGKDGKTKSKETKGDKPKVKFEGTCNRCGRYGHRKTDCYATISAVGVELPPVEEVPTPEPKAKAKAKAKAGVAALAFGEVEES